jgi:hypothetical protein
VNLAVHVSAPRALRPPLRTVIEEAWRTFFTRCTGRAVKYGQQPVCAATGPTGRPVLSMSGYPCRGWRDNSKKKRIIIDVTSCEAIFFRPRREGCLRVFIFSRYVLSGLVASLVASALWSFSPTLRNSSARITFRWVLPSILSFSKGLFELGFSHDYLKESFLFG